MNQTTDPAAPEPLDDFLGVQPPPAYARPLKYGAIALGVVLLLLLSKCVFGGDEPISYATQEIRRGDLTVSVSATGNLQPTNEVQVGSELSGLVTQVFVQNNDRVAKGQTLARLDTSRLRDAIAQSQASLQAAQAAVGTAQATAAQTRATLGRLQQVFKLSGGKVPSATELDSGRADYARALAGVRSAEAQVAQARAQLSSDQTQFGKASIVSPVTGVVLSRQIEPGQTVAASLNAPTLFIIAEDLAQMKLEVKVDEADVGQVRQAQNAAFTVDAFPGRTFPARITRVDVGANASSASSSSSTTSTTNTVVAYTAELSVANPELILRPGMTATADIVTTEKRRVLLVPNSALRFSPERAARAGKASGGGVTSVLMPPRRPGGGNRVSRDVAIGRGSHQTVYVLDDDGAPTPLRVTVGDTNGSQTEVSGPALREGLAVITGQLAAGETAGDRKRPSGG